MLSTQLSVLAGEVGSGVGENERLGWAIEHGHPLGAKGAVLLGKTLCSSNRVAVTMGSVQCGLDLAREIAILIEGAKKLVQFPE